MSMKIPHRLFFECPEWLQTVSQPLCRIVGSPKLADHIHVVIFATIFYKFIEHFTPIAMHYLPGGRQYEQLNQTSKEKWNIQMVSMVQSFIICPLAVLAMMDPRLKPDFFFSYSPLAGDIYALALGYFVWDSYICLKRIRQFGFGFAMHGVSSMCIFSVLFRPFLMPAAPDFILFELSTPCSNLNWMLIKADKRESFLRLVNGLLFTLTFFVVRVVWGQYRSYYVFYMMYLRRDEISSTMIGFFVTCFVALTILNLYWFRLMIVAVVDGLAKAVKFRKQS